MSQAPAIRTPTTERRTGLDSFRQPGALYVVSGLELAERFSYFGILAILLYYLYFPTDQGGLGLPQPLATSLVGAYGGGIYLAMALGGWLADRLLGSANTLAVGASGVIAGHLTLAFLPGVGGLLLGLLLIALGSGCTKATTASVVGSLYAPGDAHRIVGFTIFYLSANLGALFGGIAVASFQQVFGFRVGLAVGAVGMAIGLLISLRSRSRLPEGARRVPDRAAPAALLRAGGVIALLALGFWLGSSAGLLQLDDASTIVAVVAAVLAGISVTVMRRSKKVSTIEFRAVARYLPIFAASALHVGLWMQLYLTVAVYAEARTDRIVFGFELSPSTAIASGAVVAIALTPAVNAIWTRLGRRQPTVAIKYTISLLTMGVCFAIIGMTSMGPAALVPIWLVLGIAGAFYLADLVASPAGLSYATAMAPSAFRSQMVALHYMSYAIGAAVSGILAQFYDPNGDAGEYFVVTAVVSAAGAVGLTIIRRPAVPAPKRTQRSPIV